MKKILLIGLGITILSSCQTQQAKFEYHNSGTGAIVFDNSTGKVYHISEGEFQTIWDPISATIKNEALIK